MKEETIAAIATPHGEGGISVLRVSGEDAFEIVNAAFQGRRKIRHTETMRVYHGYLVDGEEPVDEVLATTFRAPHSYTGENVVEISCHGSPFIAQRILDVLIQKGARPSKPGEFTERAYLNGRMDLVQAEAVADLIQARTESSRRVAMYQLEGRLSQRVEAMRQALINAVSLMELELDFGEEDVCFTSRKELKSILEDMAVSMKALIASYDRGRVCREGVRMVIVGKPNVGKSSILNALLEKERAIVTEVPGTTRDTVEDVLDIEGVLFKIIDTAGIRSSQDPIEKEGIRRSLDALEQADLVLLVLDGSTALEDEDQQIIRKIAEKDKRVVVVLNKSDLERRLEQTGFADKINVEAALTISAKKGKGIDELIDKLKHLVLGGGLPNEGDVLLTRERHRSRFQQTVAAIEEAQSSLDQDMSQEFVTMDLRKALHLLGEIVGETTADDILNNIFSRFCIGK